MIGDVLLIEIAAGQERNAKVWNHPGAMSLEGAPLRSATGGTLPSARV